MGNEKMRGEFEAWLWNEGIFRDWMKDEHGEYKRKDVAATWKTWKAATSATQRDAMAVAEAVRRACAVAVYPHDNDAIGTANIMAIGEVDLAAIVEAVQPSKPEPVAWEYCPECGCEEFEKTGHGNGRFCDDCGQEWFPDIDYTHVVQGHLAKRKPASGQQQGEPVAWIERQLLNGELIMSVVKDQKMPELERARLAEYYDLEIVPLYTAPACSVPDYRLRARVADLIHLLKFIGIDALSESDKNQAMSAMADISTMLSAAPKPEGVA